MSKLNKRGGKVQDQNVFLVQSYFLNYIFTYIDDRVDSARDFEVELSLIFVSEMLCSSACL